MTADDVRARFEAWLLDRGIEATRRANGHYQSDETCFWWKLWQDAESAAHADRDAEVRELVEEVREIADDLREWGSTDAQLATRSKRLDAALAKFHPTQQEKP